MWTKGLHVVTCLQTVCGREAHVCENKIQNFGVEGLVNPGPSQCGDGSPSWTGPDWGTCRDGRAGSQAQAMG